MKEFYHDVAIAHLLDAQDITDHTDTGSKYADLAGFQSALVLANVGAVSNTDASNKLVLTLQECDSAPGTNTSWTDVASADKIGSFTAIDGSSDDQTTMGVAYIGSKRYIRVKLDFTSAGSYPDHCLIGISALLGNARHGAASSITPTTGTSTG